MPTISNITPVPAGVEATRATTQTQATSPVTPRAGASRPEQAVLSTSGTYREFQAELLRKMEGAGFTSEQALKLLQIGNLSVRQFTRATVIGQILMHDPGAFDGFVGTLKNVVNRGKNVQDGVRTFLEGMDRLLGQDTRELTEEVLQRSHAETESVTRRTYAPHGRVREDAQGFERELANEADLRAFAASLKGPAADVADVAEYVRFFNASMEEFPTRYHVDAFAQNEFARLGLPLKDYVKLASEIPPLRVLNLLAKAAAAGQPPEILLQALLTAFDNGEDLHAVLTAMERAYGADATVSPVPDPTRTPANPFPVAFSSVPDPKFRESGASAAQQQPAENVSHAGRIPDAPRFIEATPGGTVEIKQGEQAIVEFLALGAKEGVLSADRTASLLLPQRAEIPGQALNLSFLPVGVYLVTFAGVDSANRLANLWMKVVVRERDEKEESLPRDDDGDESGGQSDRPPRKKPPEDFLKPDFSGAVPVLTGPFLGEILLPLDFPARDPGGLAVLTHEGVVVSREEFERGVFPHHAVSFRFLANHVSTGDPLRRHAPLSLAPSAAFEKFDALMTRFLRNPRVEAASWEEGVKAFFTELSQSFPAGAKTFEVAREVFLREAKAFLNGEIHDALYDAVSIEKDGPRFVAACYAKGACALAAAGDAPGALGGFARAALTDLGDPARKAELGTYLRNLRDLSRAQSAESAVRGDYAAQAEHGFGETSIGTEVYELAERFIDALEPGLTPLPSTPS